jgi:hypothetical protein
MEQLFPLGSSLPSEFSYFILQPDHRHIFHNQLVALPAYHKAIIHDRFAFCFPIASFSPNILLFKINA